MKPNKGTKNDLSRRDFIKTTAVGVGATALAGLGAKEAKATPLWDYEADVVVIGAGAVGLPAAIKARDEGASVIVVDANWDIGGKAIISGGWVALGGGTERQKQEGIVDSPDILFKDMTDWSVVRYSGNSEYRYNDREMMRAYADNAPLTHAFLLANGVVFGPALSANHGASGCSVFRREQGLMEGMDKQSPLSPAGAAGSAVMRPLEISARAKGVKFLLCYHMDKIFRDDVEAGGRVTGIQAHYTPCIPPGSTTPLKSFYSNGNIETTAPTVAIRARKAVIIGTGGYGHNVNLRRIYDPRLTDEVQACSQPFMPDTNADGSGILAAMGLGASLWSVMQMHEMSMAVVKRNVIGCRDRYTQFFPESPCYPFAAGGAGINIGTAGWGHVIAVNQVGKRFYNESKAEYPGSAGTGSVGGCVPSPYIQGDWRNCSEDWVKSKYQKSSYLDAALAMNEGSVAPDYAAGPIWVIFDAAAVARRNWNVEYPNTNDVDGYFFKADTIAELAAKVIGNRYQKVPMPPENLEATIAKYNELATGGVDLDFGKTGTLYPINTPPFYAAWATPILHDTYGGLRINGKCQVMDLYGKVIPGLYAGGEATGGGIQHGLGRCHCQGFIAGKHAAAELIVR
jgi:succinate dehydrogenase/fumarate reductase flavoprotein subunit